MEEQNGQAVVHVYELVVPTQAYTVVGIFRDALTLAVPFALAIDLKSLVASKR